MTFGIPTFQRINELHHACTDGTFTRYDDFHVFRHEEARVTCRLVMPAHRCAFYQVGFDENADYELAVNGHTLLTRPRQLRFSAPGHTLGWAGGTGVWQGTSAHFTANFLHASLGNAPFLRAFPFFSPRAHVALALDAAAEQQVRALFENMVAEANAGAPYGYDVVRHHLLALLYLARRLYDQQVTAAAEFPAAGRAWELATACEALVEAEFLTYRTVGALADRLCVTPDHLSEAVQAVYGRSARALLHERRLREARTLLAQTRLPVGAVAAGLQFASVAHFSRFFRQATGHNPREFRQGLGSGLG